MNCTASAVENCEEAKRLEVIGVKPRPPLPPFSLESARLKVQAAEDAWNSRDAARVALAYTEDTEWRNRSEFLRGRAQVEEFLRRKWAREHEYRLRKELWSFTGNRIAVRFEYEFHDDAGQWWRAYGNENWEFDVNGLMQRRFASINDLPIAEAERKFRWPRSLPENGEASQRRDVADSSPAQAYRP